MRRTHADEPEIIALGKSGEVFELEEQIRQTVAAFKQRHSLVSGIDARKRIIVCLEAERALAEKREIALNF